MRSKSSSHSTFIICHPRTHLPHQSADAGVPDEIRRELFTRVLNNRFRQVEQMLAGGTAWTAEIGLMFASDFSLADFFSVRLFFFRSLRHSRILLSSHVLSLSLSLVLCSFAVLTHPTHPSYSPALTPPLTHLIDPSPSPPPSPYRSPSPPTALRLFAGTPVNVHDERGNTPLHVACQTNNKKMAKLCLRWGAELNAQNAQGQVRCTDTDRHRHTGARDEDEDPTMNGFK